MTPTELADKICAYVRKEGMDYVSQAQLIARFGDELRGDRLMEVPSKHLVLFVGCSQLFADAVHIIEGESPQRVYLETCDYLVMLTDGCPVPLDMPTAKKVPKGGYKTNHFVPICFRPGP